MRLPVIAFVAWTACAQPLQVPFIQQEKNGCGAASVAMVMGYWGGPRVAGTKVYNDLIDARRKGILLDDMKRYLIEHGYHAFTLRGQWPDLEDHLAKGRPIIIGLRPKKSKGIHFAVLVGSEDGSVWLNDPTRTKAHRMKQPDFRKQWELAENWMLLATPAGS